MSYKPVTLPPLPRERCPFEDSTESPKRGVHAKPCTRTPLENGWCAAHQYCFAYLERVAEIGYMELQINEHLIVLSGAAYHEAIAIRMPLKRKEQADIAIATEQAKRADLLRQYS